MESNQEKKTQTIVEVIDGGPLKITGNIVLKDLKRNLEQNPAEICICMCGRSGNKPLCDCSHSK